MKAGRELDALVAEKVMGIELCHHELDKKYLVCKHCHVSYGFWKPKWGRIEPPRYYSTNIAAAWKVVKSFTGKAYVGMARGKYSGDWKAVIGDGYKTYEIEAETVSLAICLAALKAKGIDV